MADSKITALTSISTSTDPAVDPLVIVDVSDTSMAASGTSKKVTLNNLLSSSPTATGAFTVSGLVTAGSATITGNLTVGTGANSAVQKAAILGGYTVFENSAGTGNPSITFNNDTDTGILNNGANVLQFNTAGVERARFNPTGAFVLYGGAAFATGIGIAFPAAQVASSDANCLDDYEEGTTSTITIATQTSGTITLNGSFNTLSYTKIGRLVTVTGNLLVSSVSLPVGVYIDVSGLPFARNGSRNTDTSPSISVISAVSAGATTFYGYIPTGATSNLRIIGDATQYQSNTEIMISLQYFV